MLLVDFRRGIVQFSDLVQVLMAFRLGSHRDTFTKKGLFSVFRSGADLSMPRKGVAFGRCDGKSGWAVVSSRDV